MDKAFDLESIMNGVRDVIVNYLNTKIDDINDAKADGLMMTRVDMDNGLFLQQFNGKATNSDPIILYAVIDITSEGKGPILAKHYDIDVVLIKSDQGEQIEIGNLMYRYQRVLEEVFAEHWTENRNQLKMITTSLVPRPLTLMNASHDYRAVGISLRASIG